MTNRSLKSDLKTLLAESENINDIKRGGISNHSIEIEFLIPPTFSSYVYYDKADDRDDDYYELQVLISENN